MKSPKINKQPLISVILPVFNASPYLKLAIESVLQQTYKKWELIIIDDASTDNSWQIIKSLLEKDPRIKAWKNKKKLGLAQTLNRAVSFARADFLARMDADDLMYPRRLERQIDYLVKHPKLVALGTWLKEINTEGKEMGERVLPLEHQKIYQMMYYVMGLQHPSIMFNRKIIPQNFTWYQGENEVTDLDLIFRLLKYGDFANLPDFLMAYRLHPKNVSLKNIKKTFKQAEAVREKAIKNYHYRPNLKAQGLHLLAKIIVCCFPRRAVFFFYSLLRNNIIVRVCTGD